MTTSAHNLNKRQSRNLFGAGTRKFEGTSRLERRHVRKRINRILRNSAVPWAAEGGGPYGVGRWIFGEFGVRRAGRVSGPYGCV